MSWNYPGRAVGSVQAEGILGENGRIDGCMMTEWMDDNSDDSLTAVMLQVFVFEDTQKHEFQM